MKVVCIVCLFSLEFPLDEEMINWKEVGRKPSIYNLINSRDIVGRDSSVGIANPFGLDGTRIESQCGEARFSAFVHTGPGVDTVSCKMDTGLLSRG